MRPLKKQPLMDRRLGPSLCASVSGPRSYRAGQASAPIVLWLRGRAEAAGRKAVGGLFIAGSAVSVSFKFIRWLWEPELRIARYVAQVYVNGRR